MGKREKVTKDLVKLRILLEHLLYSGGLDPYQPLTKDDIRWLFNDDTARAVLEALDVKQGLPFEHLWHLLYCMEADDKDETGEPTVEFDDLFNVCQRLRGSHGERSRKLLLMQGDVRRGLTSIQNSLSVVQSRLQDFETEDQARVAT